MSSAIELRGLNGQPLAVTVNLGMRTARDLRSLLLEASYSLQDKGGSFLALLFKCGFSPQRLSREIEAFKAVVRADLAPRIRVLALEHAQSLEDALRGQLGADQLRLLQDRVMVACGGEVKSSSRQAVQLELLRRWLHGLPPITTAELAAQCGASAPTVSAAIRALAPPDVLRTRDRRVALRGFSTESWQNWLTLSAGATSVKYIDRSGSPRSPDKLAKLLSALALKHVAIGGVLGALHHEPALDITGAPRLDLLVHGTVHADLSFIERLDPGLVHDDSPEARAAVVLHFSNRRESHFDVSAGVVWADVLDCMVHMWQAGLTHQVQDLISRLSPPTPALAEEEWTTH